MTDTQAQQILRAMSLYVAQLDALIDVLHERGLLPADAVRELYDRTEAELQTQLTEPAAAALAMLRAQRRRHDDGHA